MTCVCVYICVYVCVCVCLLFYLQVHAHPFFARVYRDGFHGGAKYSNDDWLSSPVLAAQLSKMWCKWDFKRGREPFHSHYIACMCDVALEYTSSPQLVLNRAGRQDVWRHAGCRSDSDQWLAYRGTWYHRRTDFEAAEPGCIA